MNTPAKYRKKPVVIEALQFTGYNLRDVAEFMGEMQRQHETAWERAERLTEENERLDRELNSAEAYEEKWAKHAETERQLVEARREIEEQRGRAERYGAHIDMARRLLNSIVESKHPEDMSYYWYEAVDRFLRETIEIPEALQPPTPTGSKKE